MTTTAPTSTTATTPPAAGTGDRRFAILYVDDEEQALKYFRKAVEKEFPVLIAPNVDQALAILEQEHARIGVLITDQRMPGKSGVDLLTHVRQSWPEIVRMMVTAYSDMESAISAVNSGAVYKYLTKPVDLTAMRGVLREAMGLFLGQRDRDALLREKTTALQQMIVEDRVRSMAAMASGISHHFGNAMTALTCYFEELDAAPAAGGGGATPGVADPANASYLDQLRDLAKEERTRLVQIVRDIGAHVARPQFRITDAGDVADLVRKAVEEAAATADGRTVTVDVPTGLAAVKADAAAIVRTLKTLVTHAARHARPGGQVRVKAEGPVAHWNTTGVRVTVTGDGPPWTEADVASFFTPFAVSMDAPSDLGLGLLDAFYAATAHAGELVPHPAAPDGPGFELRLPLDPATVVRPEIDAGRLAGLRGRLGAGQAAAPAA